MTDQTPTNHSTKHATSAYSPLKFDPDQFREYVQDMELSTAQQDALLEAVWLIVVGVMDLRVHTGSSDRPHSNTLVLDSSSMLASVSTPRTSTLEDAKANDRPRARRTDS